MVRCKRDGDAAKMAARADRRDWVAMRTWLYGLIVVGGSVAAFSSCGQGSFSGRNELLGGKNAKEHDATKDAPGKSGDARRQDADDDPEALPPEIISGAYLACVSDPSQAALGCAIVQADGAEPLALEAVRLEWTFEGADGTKLVPAPRGLGAENQVHGLFVFSADQLAALRRIHLTVRRGAEAHDFHDVPAAVHDGSKGSFAASIDLGRELAASSPGAPAPTRGGGVGGATGSVGSGGGGDAKDPQVGSEPDRGSTPLIFDSERDEGAICLLLKRFSREQLIDRVGLSVASAELIAAWIELKDHVPTYDELASLVEHDELSTLVIYAQSYICSAGNCECDHRLVGEASSSSGSHGAAAEEPQAGQTSLEISP